MALRQLFITEYDRTRLEALLAVSEGATAHDREDWNALAEELDQAEIVASRDVPAGVVTMNSQVVLRDLDSGEAMTVRLVFPDDADAASGAISVLAPIGTAILGYAEGDEVAWPVPAGLRRILIDSVVYQPEQAGDYHL